MCLLLFGVHHGKRQQQETACRRSSWVSSHDLSGLVPVKSRAICALPMCNVSSTARGVWQPQRKKQTNTGSATGGSRTYGTTSVKMTWFSPFTVRLYFRDLFLTRSLIKCIAPVTFTYLGCSSDFGVLRTCIINPWLVFMSPCDYFSVWQKCSQKYVSWCGKSTQDMYILTSICVLQISPYDR